MAQKAKEEMALIKADDSRVLALDAAIAESALTSATENPFARLIKTANAIATIRTNLDEQMMGAVMMLQGTGLGFRTDKDKEGGYPMAIVRDAVIEATLRGLHPVGNQFNIIAGRFYCTKEGFKQLLDNIKGLTWFILPRGIKQVQNGTEVDIHAKFTLNGKTKEMDWTFPVRVNAGMGADGILGKAERKARKRLYEFITGVELADGDIEDTKPESAPVQSRILQRQEVEVVAEEIPETSRLDAELKAKGADITTEDIRAYCAATRTVFDEQRALDNLDAVIAAVDARKNN